MLQTLFYIPNEIAGLPVFGFGLLLAVWALLGVGVLAWLGWRQGFGADTWGYVPLLLLVGAVIWWLLPALCHLDGLPIRGYGTMMLVAAIAATGLALWRAGRLGLDPDLILSLAFWIFVSGIIGARAFYVIEYWSDQYWPVYQQCGLAAFLGAVVNVTQGGLVVYGSFVAAVLAVVVFVRKHRLSLLAVLDLIAPSIMLGLAVGRVGCLLNGCCFGGVCDHAWAVTFPAGSPSYCAQVARGQMAGFRLSGDPKAEPILLRVDQQSSAGRAGLKPGDRLKSISGFQISRTGDAHAALTSLFYRQEPLVIETASGGPLTLPATAIPARSRPVHPTQVYSQINALLLCLLLLVCDRFRRRDGELFALMISIYPITRFLLEIIRTDESPVFGTGLSISQNVSLMILVCAAGLWFYILRQPGLASLDPAYNSPDLAPGICSRTTSDFRRHR